MSGKLGPPRLVGHGLELRLREATRIARVPDAPETTLAIDGHIVDVLVPTDVLEIAPSERLGGWRIETELLSCAWPHGLTLTSDAWGQSPFVLEGPGEESTIWAQSVAVEHVTPIERIAVEGQRIRAIADAPDGSARVDLDYVLEDALWWQRKYVRPWGEGRALILCAQAQIANEEVMRAALDLLDASTVDASTGPGHIV